MTQAVKRQGVKTLGREAGSLAANPYQSPRLPAEPGDVQLTLLDIPWALLFAAGWYAGTTWDAWWPSLVDLLLRLTGS